MDHLNTENYPEGSILASREGTNLTILGSEFRLQKLVSETPDNGLNERQAIFQAEQLRNGESVIVNLRIQKDPSPCSNENIRLAIQRRAAELYTRDWRFALDLSIYPYVPCIITRDDSLTQDETYEYPGGYIHAFVVEDYPLLELDYAYEFLGEKDIGNIRCQLYDMLDVFASEGYYYNGEASMYRIDVKTKQLYTVDPDVFMELGIHDGLLSESHPARLAIRSVLEQVEHGILSAKREREGEEKGEEKEEEEEEEEEEL